MDEGGRELGRRGQAGREGGLVGWREGREGRREEKRIPVHVPNYSSDLTVEEKLQECLSLLPSLLSHVPNVLVSLGPHGLVYGRWEEGGEAELLHYPPASPHLLPVDVANVTGAGDR